MRPDPARSGIDLGALLGREEVDIVLTDRPDALPASARKDAPCPRCGAEAKYRVETAGFGRRRPVACSQCGYQFPPEAAR